MAQSKESACNAEDMDLIPGSGRSSGEGNGKPLQYSCLWRPMDSGAWRATTVHGVEKELDTTYNNKQNPNYPGFFYYWKEPGNWKRDCYKFKCYRHLQFSNLPFYVPFTSFFFSFHFLMTGLQRTTGALPNPPSWSAWRNITPDWGWISSSPK